MSRLSICVLFTGLLMVLGGNANASGDLIKSIELSIKSDLGECSAIRQVRSALDESGDTATLIAMLETTESDEFAAELNLIVDIGRISDLEDDYRATTTATALIDYLFDVTPTQLDELRIEVEAFPSENFKENELQSLSSPIQKVINELLDRALSEKKSNVSKIVKNPFVICFADDIEYVVKATVVMKSGFVNALTYLADKNAIRNQIEQLGFAMSDFRDAVPNEMEQYARMQSGRIMGDWAFANFVTDPSFRSQYNSFIEDISGRIIRLNSTTGKNLDNNQIVSLSHYFASANRRPLSSKITETVSMEVTR